MISTDLQWNINWQYVLLRNPRSYLNYCNAKLYQDHTTISQHFQNGLDSTWTAFIFSQGVLRERTIFCCSAPIKKRKRVSIQVFLHFSPRFCVNTLSFQYSDLCTILFQPKSVLYSKSNTYQRKAEEHNSQNIVIKTTNKLLFE